MRSYATCHKNITLMISFKYVYNIRGIAWNEDGTQIIRWKNSDATTFNWTTFNCWFKTSSSELQNVSSSMPAVLKLWNSLKARFIATQLNSTDLLRADWLYAATGSVALPIVGDSWVASVRVSIATQLNSTRRRDELSCVAINGP